VGELLDRCGKQLRLVVDGFQPDIQGGPSRHVRLKVRPVLSDQVLDLVELIASNFDGESILLST